MKAALVAFVLLALCSSAVFAQGYNYVNGYYRRDGTYVQPHYRTNPDGNVRNNWSTYPNYNPFTGKQGTKRYDSGDSWGSYGQYDSDLWGESRRIRYNAWGEDY